VCGNNEGGESFVTPLNSEESVTSPQYSPLGGGEGVRGGEDPESSGGLRDGRREVGLVGREVW
jgi:hypothetical protein